MSNVKGTPLYMAPEIWLGAPPSVRSDLYSLGALLYELGSGRPPYTAENLTDLHRAVQQGNALPLRSLTEAVDPGLAELIDRCLAQAPSQRPSGAEEVLFALERAPLASQPGKRDAPINPYQGLYAFQVEQSAFFFGRSREIEELLARLRREPMVLVAGDSGLGKSSLCRAGVLARVQAGALDGDRQFRLITLFPGRRPAQTLASALGEVLEVSSDILIAELKVSPEEFTRRLQRYARERQGLFLFIDQLEELLTQSHPAEAAMFAEALGQLGAVLVPGLRVLMSARGDLLTRLTALPGLGEALTHILYLLRPLGREHLREVIVQPAAACGVGFESERLIDDLVQGALRTDAALPLLQFTLMELWEARDARSRQITVQALAQIGGVEGALAMHADRVLAGLLPEQRQGARRLMMALVTASGLRMRRRADELLLRSGDQAVVEELVRGRLLVVRGEADQATYEIAHEALLKGWGTLRDWLESEAEQRAVRERVELASSEWRRVGKRAGALWEQKRLAEVASAQLDESHLPFNEREFLAASRRRNLHLRRLRLAMLLGIPILLLCAYVGRRLAQVHERRLRVAEYIRDCQGVLEAARQQSGELKALRQRAFAAFDAQNSNEGEQLWSQAQALRPKVLLPYARATQSLELAVAADPDRPDIKERLAGVLYERALLAEEDRDAIALEELRDRTAAHDPKGEYARRWMAPGHLRLRTQPLGVQVALGSYTSDAAGRRVLSPLRALGSTPLEVDLDPGSYLLEVQGMGYAPVRLPLLVRRAESFDLLFEIPKEAEIPPGFVYIPPGRFLYGATDEALRKSFFFAPPLHEVTIGSYLIARTEVTYRDFLDYLRSLPAAAGGSTLALQQGRWQVRMESNGHVYTAQVGEPIVYAGRADHIQQDWLRMPVGGIDANEALAYARWLDESGRVKGARLCSEVEWERAARGADDRLYPHGDALFPSDANYDATYERTHGPAGPDEVGSHEASRSPFGIDDMAGNNFEWVLGATKTPGTAVARGGAFKHGSLVLSIPNRALKPQTFRDLSYGLRICADFPRSQP